MGYILDLFHSYCNCRSPVLYWEERIGKFEFQHRIKIEDWCIKSFKRLRIDKNAIMNEFIQSFDESELSSVGNYKAAGVEFSNVDQVKIDDLRRWLTESMLIQWDYKNIVKRKGLLERLRY